MTRVCRDHIFQRVYVHGQVCDAMVVGPARCLLVEQPVSVGFRRGDVVGTRVDSMGLVHAVDLVMHVVHGDLSGQ